MGAALFLLFASVTAIMYVLLRRDEDSSLGAMDFVIALFCGGFALGMGIICIAMHYHFAA